MHRAITKEHDVGDQVTRDLFKDARQRWATPLLFTIEDQFNGNIGHLVRRYQGINSGHQGNHRRFIIPGRARDNTPRGVKGVLIPR